MPVWKRDIGIVFQSYALFPHMSVMENVVFGLKRRGIRGDEARRRAGEALETVRLIGLRRPPAETALRRSAAARGAGARHRHPAEGAAARRAAIGARPAAAPGDAGGAAPHPARERPDDDLRHPRPGGSADALRPHRHSRQGPHHPGGRAFGDLRAAAHTLCRELSRRREFPRRHRRARARCGSAKCRFAATAAATGRRHGGDAGGASGAHVDAAPAEAHGDGANAMAADRARGDLCRRCHRPIASMGRAACPESLRPEPRRRPASPRAARCGSQWSPADTVCLED